VDLRRRDVELFGILKQETKVISDFITGLRDKQKRLACKKKTTFDSTRPVVLSHVGK